MLKFFSWKLYVQTRMKESTIHILIRTLIIKDTDTHDYTHNQRNRFVKGNLVSFLYKDFKKQTSDHTSHIFSFQRLVVVLYPLALPRLKLWNSNLFTLVAAQAKNLKYNVCHIDPTSIGIPVVPVSAHGPWTVTISRVFFWSVLVLPEGDYLSSLDPTVAL